MKFCKSIKDEKPDYFEEVDHSSLFYKNSSGLSSAETLDAGNIFGDMNGEKKAKYISMIYRSAQEDYGLSHQESIELANHIHKYGFEKMKKLAKKIGYNKLASIISNVKSWYHSVKSNDANFSISIAFHHCPTCKEENGNVTCCMECDEGYFEEMLKAYEMGSQKMSPCYNCSKQPKYCNQVDSNVVMDITRKQDNKQIDELYDEIPSEYHAMIDILKELGFKEVNDEIYNALERQVAIWIKADSNEKNYTFESIIGKKKNLGEKLSYISELYNTVVSEIINGNAKPLME